MSMHFINLIEIQDYPESTVVTRTSNGVPLSYIFDDTWDFSGNGLRGVGKPASFSFVNINDGWKKDIQSTLFQISQFIEENELYVPNMSSVRYWKDGLFIIAQGLDGTNWSSLSDDKVSQNFLRRINKLSLSKSLINTLSVTINKLNQAGICHRTFDNKDFKCNSPSVKQAIAIPIGMYAPLLSNAIKIIETYHPYRHKISGVMKKAHGVYDSIWEVADPDKTIKSIRSKVGRELKKIKHNIPGFNVLLNGDEILRIQSSCLLVALAFTGARIGEVLSFNKKSYKEKPKANNEVISLVKGETTKGTDGIPKNTVWQTHSIVKDALELSYDMTEYSREFHKNEINDKYLSKEITNDQYIHSNRELSNAFIVCLRVNIKNFTLSHVDRKLYSLMNSFGIKATEEDVEEFNRLNPSREGDLTIGGLFQKLSPHDFRRSFAVFFKRYGFGSAVTLKFQYKHKNINMSDYYANNAALQAMEDVLLDNELLNIMNQEGINMGVDIFHDIYNETTHLSGGAGDRITKDKFNELEKGHNIFMNRAEIESLVKNGTLSAVKLPTGGYCLNSTCSRLCGIFQFAAEIKPCEHQVITDNEAKNILRQNKRLVESFRGMNTGDTMMQSILIGLKQKIKLNEIILKKHKLKFDNFDDAVKNVINTQEV